MKQIIVLLAIVAFFAGYYVSTREEKLPCSSFINERCANYGGK